MFTGDSHVRFHAGVPLVLPDGNMAGTLCLIDNRPRDIGTEKQRLLSDLGQIVEAELVRDVA